MSDYRYAGPNLRATRASDVKFLPKASSAAAKLGVRYENRIARQLTRFVTEGKCLNVEHGPWFDFSDKFGYSTCSPDFILWLSPELVTIVEIKLSWVPIAKLKLDELYLPVVENALGVNAQTLVITKYISADAPRARHTFTSALSSPSRLLHYVDNGHMIW
jgi:hypothetical protein